MTKTNTEIIYKSLEKDIMNLTYKPGQIITEQEISNRYGISRTPCRDIMQKLKMTGLITSIPFKASYITPLNMDVIKQGIYMRTAVEYMIIRDVMRKSDERFIAELEYNLKLQELLLKSKEVEVEEFYELDCQFHKLWYNATENFFIWEQIEKAQIHYKRFRMLDIVEVKNFTAIYEDHKKLVKIIRSKNFDALEEAITKHLNSGTERLKDLIGQKFSEYFTK